MRKIWSRPSSPICNTSCSSWGQGFTFVARQKRILLEDDEFFADLVLYNRLLKCFVVIELKNGKLTHLD